MLSPEDITDLNGIPLSVIGPAEAYEDAIYNKHHPEHPNLAEQLEGLGGRVVRHSRVQLLPIPVHAGYHKLGLEPTLPATEFEQFKVTLLNHANCIADEVIDLSDIKNPKVRALETSDLQKITIRPEMGNVGVDGQWDSRRKTGQFLATYVIGQDIAHLKGEINKFLETDSLDLKLELAWKLIYEAAKVAVKPLTPVYDRTIRGGRHARAPHPKLTSVIFKIFTPDYLPSYLEPLEERLRMIV